MSKATNNLVFRNYLTSDIEATKALSFCPDIVPHFGNTLTSDILISEFDDFIALPLVPNEVNNIYIRATTAPSIVPGDSTAVVLRAVPSELILWPQAWNKTKPIGPGPLVFNLQNPNQEVALNTPFTMTPFDMSGFHYALIATQVPLLPSYRQGNIRLRDALPGPPPDAKNWKDMVNFINNDTSTAYYNVVVADPSARVISVSTRLHIVDNGTTPLNFNITVENSVMPNGTLVSLSSPSGMISMGKTPLMEDSDVGVHVSLPPNFDDTITITIYPPNNAIIETFAWVSLQASIVVSEETSRGLPISNVYLLGAQNIVFHDDATTNLKFASPSANRLKRVIQSAKAGDFAVSAHDAAAIAVPTSGQVTGAAVGWWFRDALNDTNLFPRTETIYHSPDIQPAGDTPLSNIQSVLGSDNAKNDWSDDNNKAINQGGPNYIYLRGHCTIGNIQVESRMFAIPNNLLLYPTSYSQWSVNDFDDHGNPTYATRTIRSTGANSFNVLDNPFNLLNPTAPTSGSDHYCIIAETRYPTNDNPDPNWPHEDTGAFSTSAAFDTWVGSTPTVSQRNISYRPGGAELTCTCNVAIPANVYPSSAQWTLEVDADNAPVGSAWKLVGSGPAIPGLEIGFNQTNLTAPNMIQGCHFTGLPSGGYQFSAVLQWFGQGKPPGNNMKFSFSLHTSTPPTGPRLLAKDKLGKAAISLPDEAAKWPFTVGIHHPGVESNCETKKKRKGYLGHRFRDIGPNPWPYAVANKKRAASAQLASGRSIGPTVVYSVGGDHWNFH